MYLPSVAAQSSSFFVLVRFPGDTSETPATCLLHSSLLHTSILANRFDPQPRTKDDDAAEEECDMPLNRSQGTNFSRGLMTGAARQDGVAGIRRRPRIYR